ncbi:carbamoyl transferase [Candidatus Peribacteria bacterium]|nr:carbamoyl transferase [Candidatus Peribacteria bacterium]
MNRPVHILGINSAYHESSACIVKNGELISFIEEERLNRKKHSKPARVDNADDLPVASIRYCVEAAGIDLDKIDAIAYNFQPEERLRQQVGADNGHDIAAGSWGTPEGEQAFFESNQRAVQKLNELFHRDISSIFHYVKHHVAHAAGAYHSSGFPSAAILIVDGIGESKSTWIGAGKGKEISELSEIDYPNSIGFLWEKMSEFLGFSEYDAEKVMGLASCGDADNELPGIRMIVDSSLPGTFKVNNEIMLFRTGDFTKIEQLFSIARRKKEEPLTQKHKNIAAALQRVTEEVVLNLAKEVKEQTGERRLCMAGGTALNVASNARLAEEGLFDEIYIQPAANDAGGAVGAAFQIHTDVLGLDRPTPVPHAYQGPQYANENIAEVLAAHGDAVEYRFVEKMAEATAKLLADGKLIAWFQGKMEAGPRALGHRSLLADPRHREAMDWINSKVKRREDFRPLAPSVLEEHVQRWFETGRTIPDPAKYMLMAFKTKANKKHLIPAVVHVDDTSRIQSVSKETSPEYWQLIEEFRKLTGIPMVLNTSLNVQEPIVCSPEDAIKTFLDSKMDYLVLENYLCTRKNDDQTSH